MCLSEGLGSLKTKLMESSPGCNFHPRSPLRWHSEWQSLWSYLPSSHIMQRILFYYMLFWVSAQITPALSWIYAMVTLLWTHWELGPKGTSIHFLLVGLWPQLPPGNSNPLLPCLTGRPGAPAGRFCLTMGVWVGSEGVIPPSTLNKKGKSGAHMGTT